MPKNTNFKSNLPSDIVNYKNRKIEKKEKGKLTTEERKRLRAQKKMRLQCSYENIYDDACFAFANKHFDQSLDDEIQNVVSSLTQFGHHLGKYFNLKPMIKLAEDAVIFVYYITQASSSVDVGVAIATFVKLQCGEDPLLYKFHLGFLSKMVSKLLRSEPEVQNLSEDLSRFRNVLDKYERYSESKVAKKVRKLVFSCIALGVFEKMNLDPEWLGANSALYTDFKKKNFPTYVEFGYIVLDTTLFILERAHAVVKTGSASDFFHNGDKYEEWYNEVLELKRLSKLLSDPQPHNFSESEFAMRLEAAIEQGRSIRQMVATLELWQKKSVSVQFHELLCLRDQYIVKKGSCELRPLPFAILYAGGTSIGKSTLADLTFKYLGKTLGLPTGVEYRYSKNGFAKFWDNFKSAKWFLDIDDIAFMDPNMAKAGGGDPSVMEIIQINNPMPYVPDQAHLDDKGKIPLRNMVTCASTNSPHLNAQFYFSHPIAVLRRFPYVVHVKVKSEYSTKGMLDPTKVPSPPTDIPNFWEFEVKKIVGCKGKNEPVYEDIPKFDDIKEYLQWLGKTALAHFELQKKVRTEAEKFEEMEVCSTCQMIKPCSCALQADIAEYSEDEETKVEDDTRSITSSNSSCVLESNGSVTSDDVIGSHRPMLFGEPNGVAPPLPVYCKKSHANVMAWFNAHANKQKIVYCMLCENFSCNRDHIKEHWMKFPGERLVLHHYNDVDKELFVEVQHIGIAFPLRQRYAIFRTIGWNPSPMSMGPGWTIDERERAIKKCKDWIELIDMCPPEEIPLIPASFTNFVKRWTNVEQWWYRIMGFFFCVAVKLHKISNWIHPLLGDFTIWFLSVTLPARFLFTKDWWRAVGNAVARKIGAPIWVAPAITGLTLALASYALIRSLKKNKMTVQGNVGSKPKKVDVDERVNVWYKEDFILNSIDLSPQITSTKSNPDKFLDKVQNHCIGAKIRVKTEDGKAGFKRAKFFAIGGQVFMTNNHIFPENKQYIVDMILTKQMCQVGSNVTVIIEGKEILRDVTKDVCYIRIPEINLFSNMDAYFPGSEYQPKSDGLIMMRHEDGNIVKIGLIKSQRMKVKYDELPNFNNFIFQGIVDTPTKQGDCGGIHIHKTPLGCTLVGLHISGGKNNVGATFLTKEDIRTALKHFDAFMIQSGDIMFDGTLVPLHSKSPLRYIENGNMQVYGSIPNNVRGSGSRVVPSLMQESLIKRGLVLKHGKPVMDGWKPKALAFNEMVKSDTLNISKSLLREISQTFAHEIFARLSESSRSMIHIVDMETAINGAIGIPYMDRMNASTSAGFPYNKPKRSFLEGDLIKEVTPEIRKRIEHALDEGMKGKVVEFIYNACLKDEPTSFKKIAISKTRVFVCGSIESTIIGRMLYMGIMRCVMSNRILFEVAIGTNAQSAEWEEIYRFLCQSGGYNMAGDYVFYDKTIPAAILLAVNDFFQTLAELAGWNESELALLKSYGYTIVFAIINMFGDLVRATHGVPSGCAVTSLFDSMANSIIFRYVFATVFKRLSKDHEIFEENPSLLDPVKNFKQNVHLITLGDDNVAWVKGKAINYFNHISFAEIISEFGMEYTMAEKDAKLIPWIPMNEVTFLKRKFIWDERFNSFSAPLDWNSIEKMLLICVQSKSISMEEHACAVISCALREAYQHSDERYDYLHNLLQEVVDEVGIRNHVTDSTFPSKNVLLNDWRRSSISALKRLNKQVPETFEPETLPEVVMEVQCIRPELQLLRIDENYDEVEDDNQSFDGNHSDDESNEEDLYHEEECEVSDDNYVMPYDTGCILEDFFLYRHNPHYTRLLFLSNVMPCFCVQCLNINGRHPHFYLACSRNCMHCFDIFVETELCSQGHGRRDMTLERFFEVTARNDPVFFRENGRRPDTPPVRSTESLFREEEVEPQLRTTFLPGLSRPDGIHRL